MRGETNNLMLEGDLGFSCWGGGTGLHGGGRVSFFYLFWNCVTLIGGNILAHIMSNYATLVLWYRYLQNRAIM